jgi:MFS transporter, OFA family, oxalate/formate antiporter
MIYAVFNWLGRIAFGVISDRIGRKVTSIMIFSIQFICFSLFAQLTTFFLLAIGTSLVAFCFGGMLANLPATTADYFGVSQFGLNYGLLFTAFGVGGVLGPLFGGLVRDMTGTYHISFWVTASLCMVGFMLSLMTKAPKQAAILFPEMQEKLETEPL